jgi:Radical SAM superfamily/B12 binding domain
MTTCLVTAPTATEFADLEEINARSVRRATLEPQLGVLSLAAVLEAHGDRPQIVDLNRAYFGHADSGMFYTQDFVEVAAQLILAADAEVCGLSTICSSYPLTIRIAETVKARRPEMKVILGGPQASVVDVETLNTFPFIDLVLRGEAEHTLPLLLKELRGERRLDRVPSLTYRKGPLPWRNPPAPVIEDLDKLPSPAYHLTGELQGGELASLELGRGCPFACTFCSTNDFFRRKFRLRSPERVLLDMRAIAEAYSIHRFGLVHDMFTVDRRKVVAFCNAMIASGDGFQWSCSARTDCVDDELLDLMVRAGCDGIFFGIETGSPRMQKIIDKHLDIERAHEIIDAVERLGIRSTISLIVGFPEETWEDVRHSTRMFMHSVRCPKSFPQLNVLAPLAATPLYSKHKGNLILEDLCSAMSHQGRLQREADLVLVRKHPDIFPNFYLVPVPYLDRDCVLELRELALLAVGHFRWLLSALDQTTTGLLDFFMQWRSFRRKLRPGFRGPELRHYYRTREFRADFVDFVRAHPAGQNTIVRALLDCESALRQKGGTGAITRPAGDILAKESQLSRSDVPVRTSRAEVIELSGDIQRVVDGLKSCREPQWVFGPHFYITSETEEGIERLVRISDWMNSLLRACDGQRDVSQILRKMSDELPEVGKPLRAYVATKLLEGAQNQGYLQIYRKVAPSTKQLRNPALLASR